MKESERGKEELYICDHEEVCSHKLCVHGKPHTVRSVFVDPLPKHCVIHRERYNECEFKQAECIPYKEPKEEPEKSCDNCGARVERTGECCSITRPKCNSAYSRWISEEDYGKSQEDKPKTKRVAVIAFLDVPESVSQVCIACGDDKGFHHSLGSHYIQVIDPARLRYGVCEKDETYIKPTGIDIASHTFKNTVCLIIDPPKQETIEDWLERMPKVSEDRDKYLKGDDNSTMSKYLTKIEQWQSEKPQEREE